jgi:hypothetical protein
MSPLNAAICTTISYTWVEWYYLKKQLFDLEVNGQGPRFMELKNFLLCSVDYVKVIKERTFFFK